MRETFLQFPWPLSFFTSGKKEREGESILLSSVWLLSRDAQIYLSRANGSRRSPGFAVDSETRLKSLHTQFVARLSARSRKPRRIKPNKLERKGTMRREREASDKAVKSTAHVNGKPRSLFRETRREKRARLCPRWWVYLDDGADPGR